MVKGLVVYQINKQVPSCIIRINYKRKQDKERIISKHQKSLEVPL